MARAAEIHGSEEVTPLQVLIWFYVGMTALVIAAVLLWIAIT